MSDSRPTHPKPHATLPAESPSVAPPVVEPSATASSETASPAEGPEPWRLDHFLKMSAVSDTGGQAKLLIQSGEVKVNGEVETRRRRKLKVGDVVDFDGKRYPVTEER